MATDRQPSRPSDRGEPSRPRDGGSGRPGDDRDRDRGSGRASRRAALAPLYDPAFEHDACGIGFVADAGGRRGRDVLPLALGGLAALAHRGAFGADGASSDGAGVSIPLTGSVLRMLGLAADRAAERPAVIQLFLPRTGRGVRGAAARQLVADVLRDAGLAVIGWRTVPTDPAALGAAARTCRPAFVQVFVHRPPQHGADRPLTDADFERRLTVVRRRLETAARVAGLGDVIAVPSASARTIVYKGLVAGARLGELYPDLRDPWLDVPYALFH